MKVVVIGGTGFLGGATARRLAHLGHRVRAVGTRAAPGHREGIHWVRGDARGQPAAERLVRGADAVVHAAWSSTPGESSRDPVADAENVTTTLRVIEACHRRGVGRLVFLSSGGTVYGVPARLPIHEEHRTAPIVPYGISKRTAELYMDVVGRRRGLDARIARVSNPYGPGQDPSRGVGVIAAFLGRASTGGAVEVFGDGSVVRDFIYVDDAVEAIARYTLRRSAPPLLNIGSGRGTSVREVLRLVERTTGRRLEVRRLPGRRFDVPRIVLDIRRARRVLRWRPKVTLAEGIARTWKWFKARDARRSA